MQVKVRGIAALTAALAVSAAQAQTAEVPVTDSIDEAALRAVTQIFSAHDLSIKDVADPLSLISSAALYGTDLSLTIDDDKLLKLQAQSVPIFAAADKAVVWWVQSGESGFENDEQAFPFLSDLKRAALEVKMPLMLPLLDLEEVQSTAQNPDAAVKATARYGTACAVLVRAYPDHYSWQAFNDGIRIDSGEVSGDKNAATAMVRAVSLAFNQKLKPQTGTDYDPVKPGMQDGALLVQIAGINDLRDLKTLRDLMVSFGYSSAGMDLISYVKGSLMLKFAAGADPAVFDSTLINSAEFEKIGPWHYRLIKARKAPSRQSGGIAQADPTRPNLNFVRPVPAVSEALE